MTTNYCAHAIESWPTVSRWVRTNLGDNFHSHWEMLYSQIAQAIKFRLPDGGRLLNLPINQLNEQRHEFVRLPFPRVALEYRMLSGELKPGQFAVTERLLVLVETGKPRHPIAMQLFIHLDGVWCPADWGLEVAVSGESSIYFNAPFTAEEASVRKEVIADESGDELGVMYEFLAALSCKNIALVDSAPAEKLNASRAKKGKQQFFTYKELVIEAQGSTPEGAGMGGTHASPRVHLRRGHIRRLSGGNVWVNAAVVGSKSLGMVTKDYRVIPKGEK